MCLAQAISIQNWGINKGEIGDECMPQALLTVEWPLKLQEHARSRIHLYPDAIKCGLGETSENNFEPSG